MPIHWSASLAVGVEQIDDEHKELFGRVNALLEAMQASRAREQVQPLVGFLRDYAVAHFAGEQALMHAHRYPGAADHLAQHAWFVAELGALSAEVERDGPTALLTIKLTRLLCDWLRQHVSSTDRSLGEFLQTAGMTARA